MGVTPEFDAFAQLVRSRRTHLLVDRDREVPPSVVDRLCELGTWAPNHKKTWPWRFASFTGDARYRLGEAFHHDMVERGVGDEGKRLKTLTKYARSPVSLAVACRPHDNPTFHDENRDAVAAAVQNILLGATAIGLASFWSTPPLNDARQALALCGFDVDDRFVAIIYLGWPNAAVDAPERPPANVAHFGD